MQQVYCNFHSGLTRLNRKHASFLGFLIELPWLNHRENAVTGMNSKQPTPP
jgi:hypothetical protein